MGVAVTSFVNHDSLECSTDGMLVRVPVCHQKKKSDGFFACVRQHIYSCVQAAEYLKLCAITLVVYNSLQYKWQRLINRNAKNPAQQ